MSASANYSSGINIKITRNTVIGLFILLLLGLGAGAAYWIITTPPQPTWYVKYQIWRQIKRLSGNTDFKYEYKFSQAPDVSALMTKISGLETNLAPAQSEMHRLEHSLEEIHRVLNPVRKETEPLRSRLLSLNNELSNKGQRLTNSMRQLAIMLTNLPNVLSSLPAATLTNAQAMAKEIETLKAQVEPLSAPLQGLRDEIASLQDQMNKKFQSIAPQQKELRTLQRSLPPPRRASKNDTDPLPPLTEEQLGASNKIAQITAAIAPTQEELDNLQKQLAAKRQELNEKQKDFLPQILLLTALTNRHTFFSSLQTDVAALSTTVRALEKEIGEKKPVLDAKLKSTAATQETHDKTHEQINQKQKEIGPKLNEIATLKKDLNSKLKDVFAQQNEFNATFKKKFDDARTYAQMYALLGQQLWVAEQLLEGPDVALRKIGLGIASQAVNYCLDPIENMWLACRICEAYVVPSMDYADEASNTQGNRGTLSVDTLLRQCGNAFRQNEENENMIHVLEISINRATNPRTADYSRYMLAREYENLGKYREALSTLRTITNTNNWNGVMRRIPYLEQRVKNQK